MKSMKFSDALHTFSTILENGPLTTRLVYDYQYKESAIKAINDPVGRKALIEIYKGNIDTARKFQLPIIISPPTFRASRSHLPPTSNVRDVNLASFEFIREIKSTYDAEVPIFIDAPLGSMNDAYSVDPNLTVKIAKAYHQEQMDIFKEAQVDFVNALTISSFNEALGIALAAQQSDLDYTIGLILNEKGTLLDGTMLHEAIQKLDAETTKKSLGYMITCTHASVIFQLDKSHSQYQRLIGVQANGSSLLPQQLVTMTTAVADDPDRFADDMLRLKKELNLIIIAGCCGTTKAHLHAIAQRIKQESQISKS